MPFGTILGCSQACLIAEGTFWTARTKRLTMVLKREHAKNLLVTGLATSRNKLCTFYYLKHSDSSHKEADSFQCLLRGTQSLNLPLKLPFLPKFSPYVEQDASIKLLLLTEKLPAPHV